MHQREHGREPFPHCTLKALQLGAPFLVESTAKRCADPTPEHIQAARPKAQNAPLAAAPAPPGANTSRARHDCGVDSIMATSLGMNIIKKLVRKITNGREAAQ
jgi:hypothetical protein